MTDGRPQSIPRTLIALVVGVPVTHVLLRATPLGSNFAYVILGVPTLILLWAGAAIWGVVLCARYAERRLWRLTAFTALIPAIVLASALAFPKVLYVGNYVGDVLHFIVTRPHYDRIVAALPKTGGPRLAVFNWGGMIWASGGLVFDESDEVALRPGKQSTAWRDRARNTELSCEGYGVQPLWSHYYLASFPC